MGLAQVWDIVWDSEPFHWATAAVLFVAVIVELYTVWQYWHLECGTTDTAIKFLSNLKKGKTVQPNTGNSPLVKGASTNR